MSVQSVNQPYFEDIASAIREKNGSTLVQNNIVITTASTNISNMLYMENNLWLAINTSEGGTGYFRDDVTGNITSAGSQPTGVASYVGAAYGDGVAVIAGSGSALAAYRTATSSWVPAAFPRSQTWTDVCYGDGVFFALGYNSSYSARSTDGGKHWTQVKNPEGYWNKVVYGNGVFVAVEDGGPNVTNPVVMYSNDMGITWTGVTLSKSEGYCSIAYGKGKFVAVAPGYVAYSTDGKAWTEVEVSVPSITDIAYGAGMFIIVSSRRDSAWYSYDGIAWTGFTLTSGSGVWSKICYGNGEFWLMQQAVYVTAAPRLDVATIQATQFATEINKLSVDTPSKWESSVLYQSGKWNSICYGGGKFVAFGNLSSNFAMYSLNGVEWTWMTIPAVGDWNVVGYGGGKFIAIARNSDFGAYSNDGVKWTKMTMPLGSDWQSVTYGNGKFVAVSTDGGKVYSSDGITWKQIAALPNWAWMSVCYGGGKFVAVASNGAIWYSYNIDEDNWEGANIQTRLPWKSVAYGNGKFVAFSNSGEEAAYSSDGITWTSTSLPNRANWGSVCYGGGMFIAVATGSSIGVYSTDGINWKGMDLTKYNSWIDVAYGNGKFVTIATNTSEGAYLTLPSPSWGNA